MKLHTSVRLFIALIALLLIGGNGCAEGQAGSPIATPPIVTQIVNAAAAGDWKSITPQLTPDLAALITPGSSAQVTATFRSLGALQSISTLLQPSDPGTQSYSFAVHLAKGDIDGSLTLNSAGKIAALEFHPGPRQAEVDRSAYVAKGDIHLPFRGEWYALWGGTDPATNQPHMQAGGSQRYAYDLLIVKNGQTHSGDGSRNSDYYAYGQPVLAPVAGTVTTVVDGIPENKPGEMNTMFLPGNCVIIDDGMGEYFALCHLQPGHMTVKVGDHVQVGQGIGLCGNSGNASEPHLHFQMADGPDLSTANGLPITFRHFLQNGRAVDSGVAAGMVKLANQGTLQPANSSQ